MSDGDHLEQQLGPGGVHRGDHIGRADGLHDDRGVLVETAVETATGSVEADVARQQDPTGDMGASSSIGLPKAGLAVGRQKSRLMAGVA